MKGDLLPAKEVECQTKLLGHWLSKVERTSIARIFNVVDNLGIFFRMFDRLGFPLAVTLIFVISFCKQDEEHPFLPPKKHCGY